MAKSNPFEYLNYINKSKEIPDPFIESNYQPFIINRALSYFPDTVIQSNTMNRLHFLPKMAQFLYLTNVVRKRNRYSSWFKNIQDEDLKLIQMKFDCSPKEAKEYSEMLSEEYKEELRTMFGGTSRTTK